MSSITIFAAGRERGFVMEGANEMRSVGFWGNVALIARCARRYADLFTGDSAEPAAARSAVAESVRLAEARAAIGGEVDFDEALQLDGKFFDSYDITSVHGALLEYFSAARDTYDDLDADIEPSASRTLTAIRLAIMAIESAFPRDTGSIESSNLNKALDWALDREPHLSISINEDVAKLETLFQQPGKGDETGVSPDDFGPLWEHGWPQEWPSPRLTFRPRARIIRTIGDRLISGPEAAVIELVKNSYDADAKTVRITFIPSLDPKTGHILFEDDGHGMTLLDIQEKWMEPATSDKKQRKVSPGGRSLLGSKGIGRFAVARLGETLELISSAKVAGFSNADVYERTRIKKLDWGVFEQTRYLEDISFPIETSITGGPAGTILNISSLRDVWSSAGIKRLHQELRRLVSPIGEKTDRPFKIILDLSKCNLQNCGFDGASIFGTSDQPLDNTELYEKYEVTPFPMLSACDYEVDGIFDEDGVFEGCMTIRRAGMDPVPISLTVPLEDGEDPCGVFTVQLNIFDREAASIRSTAKKAGFGDLGVRDARKLLDSIAGIAIYREGFRVRPYGDAENDWLTLDAKRVQNPSMKIGHNQVAGVLVIDDENTSQLLERSSREGLEENGSFRRLQSLILTLLAEVIEPKRRNFRINAGLDVRKQSGFHEVMGQAELSWAQPILAKLPEGERQEAQKLLNRESERLISHLKELDARQAQLEAQVTLGLIIGEVMHQGNTPLAFIETEVARLQQWWPTLLDDTPEAADDREDVPKILHGMSGSSTSLRELFTALSPLAGASRGDPRDYTVHDVLNETLFLFRTKSQDLGVKLVINAEIKDMVVSGYPEDITTALTNLIDNAIHWLHHYKIPQPTINVTAEYGHAGKATIIVHDNGLGVAEEHRDQLFDVGFTKKLNGTGLGLSIAREAIYRSAGELLLVDSDVGAKFKITLPIKQ